MPVQPETDAGGAANFSNTIDNASAYVIFEEVKYVAKNENVGMDTVTDYSKVMKPKIFVLKQKHDEFQSLVHDAINTATKIGGKWYKFAKKHNFNFKPKKNSPGKFKIGKKTLKLKNTNLMSACATLSKQITTGHKVADIVRSHLEALEFINTIK